MYAIKLIENVSEEMIRTAIEMDHAAFEFSDWITEEDARMIYSNKGDCLIMLTHDDVPVGLTTVFPLNKCMPDEAKKRDKPIYQLLDEDALRDEDTGVLYLHCFLLLPSFREKGLIYKLYDGLKQWLLEKGKDFTVLYADAVSAEGRRCLERLEFELVHSFAEGGALYSASKANTISVIGKHFE